MLSREQMELSLENTVRPQVNRHGRRRITLARWWFNRMHEVVDQTREWIPEENSQENQEDMFWAAQR